jgi:hypothetical protein
MKRFSALIMVFVLFSLGCKKELDPSIPVIVNGNGAEEDWDIPLAQVKDGGVGKDGIRSIDTPVIVEGNSATFLNDDELILGLKYGNTVMAYPHKILDYHEIVNHGIDDIFYAISYCPLTGTGVMYNRKLDNKVTTFGVSGLLFNSNLIMYDRATDSMWPQMMLQSVKGENRGKENQFQQLIETTWATWKKWYPSSKVMAVSDNRGTNYDRYPYGNYRTNDDYLLFSLPTKLKNIPNKERILGIRTNGDVAYIRTRYFSEGNNHIERKIGEDNVLVFGSEKDNYMFAYLDKTVEGVEIKVKNMLLGSEPGLLFEDFKGNTWNIMGEATAGPLKGKKLKRVENYIGYAFAWAAFYPEFFVVE